MRMVVEAQLVAAVMPVDGFLRLMVPRSQAGSGDQSGVQGSRPQPLSPHNAACNPLMPYIGEALPPPRAAASAILRMQIQVSAPHRLLQSLKVFRRAEAIYSRPKRRWGASYGCDSGVAESQTATFSLEESAVCAAECH